MNAEKKSLFIHSRGKQIAAAAAAVILCAVFFFFVSGKGKKKTVSASEELFAMDTVMTVSAVGERAEEAVKASVEEIRRLDALWSVGKEDSEISRLNRHESVELSEDTARLLERAVEIGSDTDGAFDITIYPLMEAWGFTTGEYRVPSEAELEELLQHVDVHSLDDPGSGTAGTSAETSGRDTDGTEAGSDLRQGYTLPEDVQIDPGGIAKGYTSDRIMEIFEEYGISGGLISLGGNVEAWHTREDGSAWRVGIRNPDPSHPALSSAELVGVVEAEDRAVITSGGYERFFEKDGTTYHHILDPYTGRPAEGGLISVTIVSSDGCLADGLSTALFVMGRDKALDYWKEHSGEFDAVLVEEDGSISVTSGLEKIFTSDLPFTVITS